ncbi:hypothetical protein [Nocardia arizonensis]|uniref:hypothetical protein n=1 Tax=Nocardia arizonensis TaxID=1141647 RepID=UPI000A4F353E|nr:hypothetical protein [Nocardia arizonensis]
MAVPVMLAATVAGCSGDETTESSVTSSVPPPPTPADTTVAQPVEEYGTGVRIAVGETKPVVIPADAVMDIKAPVAWGDALSGLRCAVTDGTGRNEDLRSSDVKKHEDIAGAEWVTLWTFSSQPGSEVTVGCKDPGDRIRVEGQRSILVAPRGVPPVPN